MLLFNELFQKMSFYRQTKIQNYKFRKDQNLSLGAGILIDAGLKYYGTSERRMHYGIQSNGKPYFSNAPEIHFNISHSEHWAMAAFSQAPIGCDIEKITTMDLNIAKQFFSPMEYEYINAQTTQSKKEEAFFRLWTLKESFMKTVGMGMSLDLTSFCIHLNETPIRGSQTVNQKAYSFYEQKAVPGYRLACCYEDDLPMVPHLISLHPRSIINRP